MKFAYYPGCSAMGTSADYELSTQAVCRALGVKLEEIPDWNCCGSTPAHAVDTELSAALCARNLSIAAKAEAETLLTPCPSCLSNLRAAAHHMKEEPFRKRVDELLEEPAAPAFPEVTSVMQGLVDSFGYDLIAQRASVKFTGIRLAPYYGCLMSRPAEIMNFGDPENPMMMEGLLEACGADVIDFPLKTSCCGASFGIPNRPTTARLSGEILRVAQNMKADAIVVACPLCQMNLDLRQDQASKALQTAFNIPVLYFTQVLGLAFGFGPTELGFGKLCVSPDALLEKLEDAKAGRVKPVGGKTPAAKGTSAKPGKPAMEVAS